VDHRGQVPARSPPPLSTRPRSKKNSALLDHFLALWRQCLPPLQDRVADRAQTLALSSLLCLGRHTITGLLTTSGAQFQDWTAPYRLFSQQRLDPSALFAGIRTACLQQLEAAPLCLSVDDSLLPKGGLKIPGAAWHRDPQGPPFQTNLIRAQRVLQFSCLLPVHGSPAVRGVPIDFLHAPKPPKLGLHSTVEQQQEHQKLVDQLNLATQAHRQLATFRTQFGPRPVILLSDARFTTKTFLTGLPALTTLIGRLRKDARLFSAPTSQPAVGRPRLYGAPLPTPEQMRQDESLPWQTIQVHAAGADHQCRVKSCADVRWRPAGARPLCLVIIAPLAYRPRKVGRVLYREPACLICTDPDLPVAQIVQRYFTRWDIEVNFREEKTLLGVGQAQVRNPTACQSVPAFQVAAYSLLLLAALRATGDLLPPPKWRQRQQPERISAQRLVQNLRAQVWGRGLGLPNFSGFSSPSVSTPNPEKLLQALSSAVLYVQA
jgi:DDE superfamily endonuclease